MNCPSKSEIPSISERCVCSRCARYVCHMGEEQPRCDCGNDLTQPGSTVYCITGINSLTDEQFQAHVNAVCLRR